jgi:hypothetical protein
MNEQAAQIDNIRFAADGRKPRSFTSPVSATAIIALFVVLGMNLLA